MLNAQCLHPFEGFRECHGPMEMWDELRKYGPAGSFTLGSHNLKETLKSEAGLET